MLVGVAMDSRTQKTISDVKMCATHNNTRASQCKQTNAEGWAMFDLINNAEYTISAFKNGYVLNTPPIRLNAGRVIEDKALPIIMKSTNKVFHDVDKDIKKQKKQKPAVKRGRREYRVHLLAIDRTSKLERSYFDRVKQAYPDMSIQMFKDGKYKRYTCGSFSKLAEAQSYVKRFGQLGYGKERREKCFVAVFVNGKHIENIYAGGTRQKVRK
jgi:hypothetical protein